MADYSTPSPSELFGLRFSRAAGQLRCAMPGIIRAFDGPTQTAKVQPALKLRVNLGEGASWKDLPVIENVPVVLPYAQGAGLLLTLPVRPGDECLLIFADRALDHFIASGGLSVTETGASPDSSQPRSHHLTDAVCVPGIISNPRAVPAYNTEHIELRDRERKQYLSLGPEGITITDGAAVWTMREGKVELKAPKGIHYATPENMDVRAKNMDLSEENRISGSLVSERGTFIDAQNVSLNSHVHTGVDAGDGVSSVPADGGGVTAAFHNDPAREERAFDAALEELAAGQAAGTLPAFNGTDSLLLCLPDVAQAEAQRKPDLNDRKGWNYLRDLLRRWFAADVNTPSGVNTDGGQHANGPDAYWVDWNWAMSYARANGAYLDMTGPDASAAHHVMNGAVKAQLAARLAQEGLFTKERTPFDFINTDWRRWENLYHQFRPVPGPGLSANPDGLAAALSTFTFRALARGWTEPDDAGGHAVRVTDTAVFIHDIFNFAEEGGYFTNELGFWNCEGLLFGTAAVFGGTRLQNSDFRAFRAKYGRGEDFLVLSRPHLVENFPGMSYVYP